MSIPLPDLPSPGLEQIRAQLDDAWANRRSAPQETVRLARAVLEQRSGVSTAEVARAVLCLGCGLMNQGEFSVAEPELQRALRLSRALADQAGERDSLNALGTVKARQGRPVEALELFLQVRHLSVTLGRVQGEIDALSNIGATFSIMGDHPNALHHQLRVLGLGREHGLRFVERVALCNLSMTYNRMEKYDDALEAALTCLQMQAQDEPALDAMVLQNAGEAHFGLRQFAEARTRYLEAGELLRPTGDQAELAGLDIFLGQVAQQQGAFDEARHLFGRSLHTCQKIGNEYGQTTGLLHLGDLLGQSGRIDEALETLHRARTLAAASQLRSELSRADLALSRLYRQTGRYQEALVHLEDYLQLREELFSADSDQRLQSLRVQFNLEQAERERQVAQHQNAELSELNVQLEATNRDLRAAQAHSAGLLSQLEQHANEDALTGLLNRRAFDAALARLLPTQQVSVVLCDIDHFKAVNDRFSHLIGDEVLRQVAGLLRDQLRPGDLLARYGGEEFVLLLSETSDLATLALCEQLRRAIETHDWSPVHAELRLTVSLGAAVAQLSPMTAQDVVRAADDALYLAKNGGRNRAELWLTGPSVV